MKNVCVLDLLLPHLLYTFHSYKNDAFRESANLLSLSPFARGAFLPQPISLPPITAHNRRCPDEQIMDQPLADKDTETKGVREEAAQELLVGRSSIEQPSKAQFSREPSGGP